MFTGIIEAQEKILEKTSGTLKISRPEIFKDLLIGQSIAVNGACLSVVEFSDSEISFDVMSETFRRTNLGETTFVNVERAMLSNGRFEGHVVLGHVDGKAILVSRKKEESGEKFIFELLNTPENSQNIQNFLVEKGSICLNGVSLTLGKILEKKSENPENPEISEKNRIQFEIFCIPLTLAETNLGRLEISDSVTLEADYFAKIVHKSIS